MKKKYLLSIPIIAGLAALGLYVTSPANADETNPQQSLIAKLASKFNVSEDDVQAVFDEERSERQAQREQKYEESLAKAVSDGVITEDQKAALLQKHEERQSEMEANREERQNSDEKPSEEDREARKEKMEAERTEFESWAEEQGIDLDKLKEYGIMGMGGGPGGPGGRHGMPDDGGDDTENNDTSDDKS